MRIVYDIDFINYAVNHVESQCILGNCSLHVAFRHIKLDVRIFIRHPKQKVPGTSQTSLQFRTANIPEFEMAKQYVLSNAVYSNAKSISCIAFIDHKWVARTRRRCWGIAADSMNWCWKRRLAKGEIADPQNNLWRAKSFLNKNTVQTIFKYFSCTWRRDNRAPFKRMLSTHFANGRAFASHSGM